MLPGQYLLWFGLWSTRVFANPLSAYTRSHESFNKTLCPDQGYNTSAGDNNAHHLQQVEALAHGRAPLTRMPPNISSEGIRNLELLAFNELFEIAFFSSLVANISTGQQGFEVDGIEKKSLILETLTTIVAVSCFEDCQLIYTKHISKRSYIIS
jgi:hypothetical protein